MGTMYVTDEAAERVAAVDEGEKAALEVEANRLFTQLLKEQTSPNLGEVSSRGPRGPS